MKKSIQYLKKIINNPVDVAIITGSGLSGIKNILIVVFKLY